MKCPICEKGSLNKGKTRETMFGVDLGEFPAMICGNCKESFTNEANTKLIEEAAKRKGIWGLGKTTKITKAGNSIVVRIPKPIADFLHITAGQEAFVHPEKDKLVVEAK